MFTELLYFVVFQLYNNGQTVGKKMLKIKVYILQLRMLENMKY